MIKQELATQPLKKVYTNKELYKYITCKMCKKFIIGSVDYHFPKGMNVCECTSESFRK